MLNLSRIFRAFFFQRTSAVVTLGLLAQFAPVVRASDALSYTKNYFVTGDYVTAGVGLTSASVKGTATGSINLSGVPAGADIVAAFLYWQTVETTAAPPSAINGTFDGQTIVGAVRGSLTNPACASSGSTAAAGTAARVYRADVLRYLPIDSTNNVRVANGTHTIKLTGATGTTPVYNGANLVVVYRVLSLGTPLRAVVLYDGAYTMAKNTSPMTQTIGGFYEASLDPDAKMTQIVGNGQSGFSELLTANLLPLSLNPFHGAQGAGWDDPTFNIALLPSQSSFVTTASPLASNVCLTWSAIVTSTNVQDSDGDGLLDVWEAFGLHLNPGTAARPATFGSCLDFPADTAYPCLNLPAMGANPLKKDIFVELDWEQGLDGHLHIPKIAALNMIGAAFAPHGIQVHFDVGNNYQSPVSPYVVPAQYARGGDVIEESTLLCPNAKTNVCAFPNSQYAVQGWKIGYQAVKDGFPALGIPGYFDHIRKDIFHYVLFAHAIGIASSTKGIPSSTSGVADRPGGDVMITLGLWLADDPASCTPSVNCVNQTGSTLVQAGTLMHELGHNLGLSHAGLYRKPNCEPNYPSVMNYLYQARGLTDAAGNSHIDYSYGTLPNLNENALSESVFPSNLTYRVRFYGPPPATNTNLGIAKAHCDGTPLNNDAAVRLEAPIGSFTDWKNEGKYDPSTTLMQDVDFNGFIGDPVQDSVTPTLAAGATGKRWLVDSNDWGNLNLQQVGARLNVAGLSVDVGQTDLGQTDLGQTDLGQTDLGQTDLGQTDLGQTDLGQTDLGDIDYETVTSTLDPTSPSQPLTAASSLTGITLTWGLPDPSLAQIRECLIYRSDPNNPTPVQVGSVSGTPPTPTWTDHITQLASAGPAPGGATGTYYNTNYTYFIASMTGSGTTSAPSNKVTGIVDHLFITATSQSRAYGTANPTNLATAFTTAGINPPGLTGTTTCTTTATTQSPVVAAGYTIACSGQTPGPGITYGPGTLQITPAPVAASITASNKPYDTTNTATIATCSLSGVLSWDAGNVTCGGTATFASVNVGTGIAVTATITLSGSAAGNYAPVPPTASTTANIIPASQTITFAALPNLPLGTPDFTVTATASSGMSVSFTSSGSCTATGSTVHLTGTGTCNVIASQSGGGNYLAATAVTQSFTVTAPGFTNVDFTTLAQTGVGGVPLATTGNITMTNNNGEAAAAWYKSPLPVKNGFTTTFTFQITPVPSGSQPADGIAFVIQNNGTTSTTQLGGGGGNIGYAGIANSLAVEFDTYEDDGAGFNDSNANHLGIQSNGTGANSPDHGTTANLGVYTSPGANLADGTAHNVTITYDGTTMSITIDTTTSSSTNLSLAGALNSFLNANGQAYVGFTAGSGADGETAVISNWSFTAH